jgi:outer membrane protein
MHMMKRFLLVIFACIALTAQAQDNTQVLRFGYLSYEAALKAMPENAAVLMKMDSLRSAFQEELQRVENEFNRKYEDFLEGQKDFPRTILLKRQTELQEMLQKNIQFKQQSIDELKQTETLLMAPLRTRLNAAIATVAREQHLALVINTDANACPFIEPTMGVDVTEAVEQLLSK